MRTGSFVLVHLSGPREKFWGLLEHSDASGVTVRGLAVEGFEEWLREISTNMDPEEGHLWVIGSGEDQCPAFTEYGVECLRQIIIEERSLLARKPNGDA